MSTYQAVTTMLPDGVEGDALQFVFNTHEWYTMPPCIPHAGVYTFSVWMCGTGSLTLHLSNSISDTFVAGEKWKRVSISGEFTAKPETALNFAALSGNGTITVCMGQVEEGNKPSTYRDAPEDIEDNTNAAISAESEKLSSLISQTEKEITESVSATYVTRTEMGQIEETMKTNISQTAEGITASVSQEIETVKSENGELKTTVETLSKAVRVDTDGLHIEMPGADQKVLIDNDSIDILVNDVSRLHFDAMGNAEIPSLRVTEKFKMFGDTWIKTDEDIVILI